MPATLLDDGRPTLPAGLDGPLAITLGLARDPKAVAPDLTVTMAFTGTGWRVTRLMPEK